MVVALADFENLLKTMKASVDLKDALLSFKCNRDTDLQNFLTDKSVNFDKADKTRTYLILDEEMFIAGRLFLLGYFSLAIKVLTVPDELSGSQRKKLDGKYSHIENGISAYLIGQLGKNDLYKDKITGRQLVFEAMKIIKEARILVGGRVVYIECADNTKLIKFYENNGFSVFSRNKKSKLVQMITYISKFAG